MVKIIRLSVSDEVEAVKVFTEVCVKVIMAYSQIDGLRIETEKPVTEQDINHCQAELSAITENELNRRQRLQ